MALTFRIPEAPARGVYVMSARAADAKPHEITLGAIASNGAVLDQRNADPETADAESRYYELWSLLDLLDPRMS